jgi:hypothetical protein
MSAVSGAGLSNEFRRALLGGASREVSESNMFCMHVYKMLRFFFFYVYLSGYSSAFALIVVSTYRPVGKR